MTRKTLQSWLCTLVVTCNASHSGDAFVVASRWSTAASGDTGNFGQAATISWSLVPDGTPLLGGQTSRLISFLDNAFEVSLATGDLAHRPWLPLLAQAFDRWSQLGGLRFVYQPLDDGAPHGSTQGAIGLRGDVRLAGAANQEADFLMILRTASTKFFASTSPSPTIWTLRSRRR